MTDETNKTRQLGALALVLAAALLTDESYALLAPLRGRSGTVRGPHRYHRGPSHPPFTPAAPAATPGGARFAWIAPTTTVVLSSSSAAAASSTDDKSPNDAAGTAPDADAAAPPPAAAPSPPAKLNKASKRLISALSFLTGWADVALIAKYQTFATMMTGNTMKMAGAVVDRNYSQVLYFGSAILSYVLGLIAFRKSDLTFKDKSLSRVCAPLVCGLFVLSDYLSYVNPNNKLIPVSLLSAAFAVINSVGSEVGGTLTFVLTGHMTKLTALGVDRVSRAAGRKQWTGGDTSAAARSSVVIGAFFAGALWACGLFARSPGLLERGAFSAMGLLYGTLFLWQDRENLGLGAWWRRDDEHMCEIDALETTCS